MKRKGGVDQSVILTNNMNTFETEVTTLTEEVFDKHTKTKESQIKEFNALVKTLHELDSRIKRQLQPGDSARSKLFKRLDEAKEKLESVEMVLRHGKEVPPTKKEELKEEAKEEELAPIPGIKGGRKSRKARKAFKKNKTRKA